MTIARKKYIKSFIKSSFIIHLWHTKSICDKNSFQGWFLTPKVYCYGLKLESKTNDLVLAWMGKPGPRFCCLFVRCIHQLLVDFIHDPVFHNGKCLQARSSRLGNDVKSRRWNIKFNDCRSEDGVSKLSINKAEWESNLQPLKMRISGQE
jgi:hypothetical protein